MFGIMSNGEIDNELFNEMYLENKEIIENMIFYMDKNPKLLEVKLDELGYDKVQEVLAFLNNCKPNYTTISLMAFLEGYCEKKEDEIFLDLYVAIQEGKLDEWLEKCDITKINMPPSSAVEYALVKALLLNAHAHRFKQDLQIELKAPVIAVFLIVSHLLHKRDAVAPLYLGKPRQAGAEAVNAVFKANAVRPCFA